jgi:hypothetical protein
MPDTTTAARNTRPFVKGLTLALCTIIPIVAITASSGADPEAAGERAGALSVAPFLAGAAVGVWAKLAMRRWRWLDYILRFGACTIAFFALNALGQTVIAAIAPDRRDQFAPVPLTDAEKQGLFVSGGWANHRDLAFSVPVGGRWNPAPEIQREVNNQLTELPGTFAWALEDERGEGLVLILVMKGVGNDETDFRAMARGMTRGLRRQAPQPIEETLNWSSRAKEFRFAAQVADGQYLKMRCVPSDSRLLPYTLCVQTLSVDSTGLDDARNHLSISARK